MASEKVKYFSNTEVVAYVFSFLLVGIFIGYAFGTINWLGHYKNQRFLLAIKRLDAIKVNHTKIEADFNYLNSAKSMAKINETKLYKSMSFEAGCMSTISWQ